jgi:hypothetical protein
MRRPDEPDPDYPAVAGRPSYGGRLASGERGELMQYRLQNGRLVTVDVAKGEWRLDGSRITEARATELLVVEARRHGLACAQCGRPRVVAKIRPADLSGRATLGYARPPMAGYCADCLPDVVDMSQGMTL